jgi:AraC-like DNA-binding protein
MSYLIHRPQPPLDRYIDCLWHADLRMTTPREKILPSGMVELIINFGAPFRLADHTSHLSLHTESWLVTLQTAYLVNEPLAETHMIGVRFKPGGTAAFFDTPGIADQVVPLDALWGRFAAHVREQLYDAQTPRARFALLEQLLLARLRPLPRGGDLAFYAVKEIAQCHGALSIRNLSKNLGISQKHLIAQFRQVVGLSPKALARIYRFQAVLSAIDPAHGVDWTSIAHSALYYDQAHFNHDFAAFTGLRPTEYLNLRAHHYDGGPRRGQDVHFVPLG